MLDDRDAYLNQLFPKDGKAVSDEIMSRNVKSLIECDNRIIHVFNSIQSNCFDDSLPYLPNLRFLCPIVFSSPYATLVRESLYNRLSP